MMNVLSSGHPQSLRIHRHHHHHDVSSCPRRSGSGHVAVNPHPSMTRRLSSSSFRRGAVRAVADDGGESSSGKDDDGDDDDQEKKRRKDDEEGTSSASSRRNREDLERLVGAPDDDGFSGLDLATLIRKRYGRSYDVTLIRKQFMGRNLLAMNVMWKYREQRSFPLTEEEYLLRLDDVANTLRSWGAVAHVRNSLETTKDRPRIGKAVSIFIDVDSAGGGNRSDEWIYK
ncbi:uncharacterized protein LOC125515661 [Triticum urartu]|nr:uncharacterized protein LOC125515637 [Triticum urartu]XP_048537107.1 uncharacterized protein LOC125515637 [Triticum urartu]XP_048537109.1 uncharacterized protein LOC125515637 [Triticum urartu]XP_048537133.1 uncharacterized protein LOC125515661 [Triticum urartu]XP_048537134.1 uncharacterized protein LOC125515661 [Triticum urartu]XP_048537135.1 uncharacterized protein LOC125515661 [Triticum urartu]